jgi:protoporphyrin/coproporphyrin ferrochelatase
MIHVIYYAYGAPASIDQVEDFFSHVLNGKKVPGPMLDNLKAAFSKSGFPDFIASSSQRIAQGLETLLNERLQEDVIVLNAYKHTAPFVEDAVAQALTDGATKIVTLSINPIHSLSGGGAVHSEVAKLLEGKATQHIAINNWHLNEDIVAVYADRVNRALNWLPTKVHSNAHIFFTVHSQPVDEERNKPYIEQFEQLAAAIAEKVGTSNFHITYRSAHGKAGWLGPDVCEHIRTLQSKGAEGIVTCELLSLTADVESYFEIGEECQAVCHELNLPFAVSEFPGDSFDTVNALAKLIEKSI